jgi:hypothetical protein
VIKITITTNGAAGTYISATLPVTDQGSTINQVIFGRDSFGIAVLANMSGGTTFIKKYDASYPGSDGAQITLQGVYEAQ